MRLAAKRRLRQNVWHPHCLTEPFLVILKLFCGLLVGILQLLHVILGIAIGIVSKDRDAVRFPLHVLYRRWAWLRQICERRIQEGKREHIEEAKQNKTDPDPDQAYAKTKQAGSSHINDLGWLNKEGHKFQRTSTVLGEIKVKWGEICPAT